ncbi:ferrochelatase [Wielerella bovis]|uniref:ferrochelatase n=1 Tax=Wielerella bovis TaxID=2917790 RepID=UPI002018EBF7|nr:ferrochelatase [Wielerella bovis]ULJ61625.1 ferrochelatase [Wielerella bovis]ULJ63751.1 ferrochelatase [Wielerella bovis]ULJ66081.1 ferrochelatase [Wielerella bovis]
MNTFQSEFSLPLAEQNQAGILLMNLGTPDAPTPEAVRPYLRDFLSDYRVVELPKIIWQPILHGIILPFRSKKSAHAYKKVWLKEGSPLSVFTQRQLDGLRERLPENVHLAYAMSYGNPSVHEALTMLKSKGVGRLLVVPLYPQYAGSSTGAALDKVWKELQLQRNQMSIRTVSRFFNHTGYIKSLAAQIRNYRAQHGAGEKLMFSYHGIPQRHHDLGDPYPLECHETARLVAMELGLKENEYIVSFQSRFGRDKWLEPSTQDLFIDLPRKQKITKLDVICPGFVSDCVETMEEIAIAGREQFHQAGGTQFQYIPCLNDNADWLDALADLVAENSGGWIHFPTV